MRMLYKRFQWLALIGIVLLTFTAYSSAIRGGFIWDDDKYVTQNPLLTAPHGLWQIWTTTKSPQYYPLVFTTFWVERHLWGINPMGYHVVNVSLHAINAILVWWLLRRLEVPGAWMIGAIFAVHPVHVESVAWTSERKNVLSGLFYLLALTCYLRYEERRRWGWYAGTLGLFILALSSKTVTATLPVALLLIRYLRGWRIGWREVLELVPFLMIGAAMGLLTKWYEVHVVGTGGSDWNLSMGERLLVAGRASAFYVLKLLWPTDLTFSYPRWQLDIWDPTQWSWVLGVGAVGLLFWWKRRAWGRGPVVGWAFFLVSLAPALGFVNVYPMRFSFVADHFQYLASIGIIALMVGSVAWGGDQFAESDTHGKGRLLKWMIPVVGSVVLVILVALTWKQGQIYRDEKTLWQDTLNKNPHSWLAHNHLGSIYRTLGHLDEAMQEYKTTLTLNPNYEVAHYNLGNAYRALGRFDEAVQEYQSALRLFPGFADAHNNLGLVFEDLGRRDEAVREYQAAITSNPNSADAHNNLGVAYKDMGRLKEAAQEYQVALVLDPNFAEAYNNLGVIFKMAGRPELAIKEYQAAIALKPDYGEAHINMGIVFKDMGRLDEALQEYRQALTLNPTDVRIYINLAQVYSAKGNLSESVTTLEHAIPLEPNNPQIHNNLGLVYMKLGRHDDAIREYKTALTINPQYTFARNNLGAVYYQRGKLSDALLAFQQSIQLKPDDAQVHNITGLIYKELGRPKDAIREFQIAVTLKPDLVEAFYNLGQVYQRIGQTQNAAHAYKQALKIKPDYENARQALNSLRP